MDDTPVSGLERTLAPLYPYFALFGTLCFITTLTFSEGRARLLALVWLVLVPLWLRRLAIYRSRRN